MMLDWNTYRQQVIAGVGEIARLSPDTVKGYQTLGAAGQKTDLLGAKMRADQTRLVRPFLSVVTAALKVWARNGPLASSGRRRSALPP
jgi:hypothetical protein